ncbi:MAG TPA: NADH-quinone oxidoreductase subunit J [Roseiflexaceae bacterium]|nr:NADH-quinone oxidoreductase subunit J [Roseiflexaceae bacterium]
MTTLIQVLFVVIAGLILTAAVLVVTVRNIIHAALWLIAAFFGVGALYLLMEAEFVAVVQVLIYVGAVSILILFAIMLTRQTDEGVRQLYKRWWAALLVAALLFGALIVPTLVTYPWRSAPAEAPGLAPIASAQQIGVAFMQRYLLPFEVASVVLLTALVGAIVIAFEERAARRRVLTLAEEVALRGEQVPQPTAAPPPAPAEKADREMIHEGHEGHE